ncbi:ATP-binding protein [Pedobacter jeongneungensis]|uniref:ATP-binding protein n=1 Tax=Pedobacter jeongneungensis TaxID=947309 RepID=UPI000469D1DF|nr:ATP-binding protein [Pedobacter jeongneungensis]
MNAPQYIKPEDLLSVLFSSPNATAVYGGENIHILSANAAMLKLWGKGKAVIGQSLEDAVPELKGQPFVGILKKVWLSGETYMDKNVPSELHVDGRLQLFYFDFEYKAILGGDGSTRYILHTAFEVSDRMAAQLVVAEKSRIEHQLSEELTAINEEYQASNEDLAALNEEYQTANDALAVLNEEYQLANEKLMIFQQELQQINLELTDSEARFRTLVDNAPVAIAIYRGADMVIEQANVQMLKIWGQTERVIGLPLLEARPELTGHPYVDLIRRVIDEGISHTGYGVKGPSNQEGEVHQGYFDVIYKPIASVAGSVSGIIVVASDVTQNMLSRIREAEILEEMAVINEELTASNDELMAYQKQLQEVNTRLEIALDASNLGSTEVDFASGKMDSNDQFKKNFGFSASEAFDYDDLFEAILPDHRERVRGLVQQAIANHTVYHAEYPIRWRDGSLHWIKAHGRPRYNDLGAADRIVGMTSDITKEKHFEQRKDDFLSIASHELKTPITAMKASLQLLDRMKDKPFSPLHTRLIEQAGKSVEKMGVLVDDLLNMNRMSENQLQLDRSNFDLYQMLSMSCNHVRLEGSHELKLIGEQDLMVNADEHRIDQVVINFVNNAVKYAPDSRVIELLLEVGKTEVKVAVKDFGPGIKPDTLPNLFDRYYRVDHSGKAYTGLGLGLYICSEIVKKHGGRIGAESVIGEGSTFWFTLPILPEVGLSLGE